MSRTLTSRHECAPDVLPVLGENGGDGRLYKVIIDNSEAAPRFREGDIIWIDTNRRPLPSDDVYVKLATESAGALIREFLKNDGGTVTFGRWASDSEEHYARRHIEAVYCIMARSPSSFDE